MQNPTRWLGIGAVSLLLAAACASTGKSGKSPRPRDGIAEYRQVATEATNALRAAFNSLAALTAQSNRCAPQVLARFSADMRRLQVDSLRLRARAQAMQARGEAYFDHWHEHLARVKDAEVRALAERQRPELEASFRRIKLLSQEGREAFEPFVSNLRKVRNALEIDPGCLSAGSTQEWLGAARQNGEHLERCVLGIVRELDSMRAKLTPARSGGKPQLR